MKKVDNGEKKEEQEKIMRKKGVKIVIASQPPERQPTAMPSTHANSVLSSQAIVEDSNNLSGTSYPAIIRSPHYISLGEYANRETGGNHTEAEV